ncbi:FG-GAP repeat domain-containing protein [Streptomyces sp. NPDC088197]|uniref:FG-GAP repeat domain-containing protein n=1 Tax=Streptomyces sp. NPDC088197 TaxID=3365840 RepID=UPI00382049C3
MSRRLGWPRRGVLAVVAAVLTAGLGLGPLPGTAAADTAQNPAIAPIGTTGPAGGPVTGVGATGYVQRTDHSAVSFSYTWHSFDGVVTRDLGVLRNAPRPLPGPDGTEVLGVLPALDHLVRIYDLASGKWTQYPVPPAYSPLAFFPNGTGWTILSRTLATDSGGHVTSQVLHLLAPAADGQLSERPVAGWPTTGVTGLDGWRNNQSRLAVGYSLGDDHRLGLIDFATGTLVSSQPLPEAASISRLPLINDVSFGWYAHGTAELRPIADPQAAPRRLAVPGGDTTEFVTKLTGDALLAVHVDATIQDSRRDPLYSVPLDGGPARVLLDDAGQPGVASDGGSYAEGSDGSGGWATYRIPAVDGPLTVLGRFTTYTPERIGLSLARGRLTFVQTAPGTSVTSRTYTADVGDNLTPGLFSEPQPLDSGTPMDDAIPRCGGQARCVPLADGGGTTGTGAIEVDYTTGHDYVKAVDAPSGVLLDSSGGRIVAAGNQYVLYESGSNGKQYVVNLAEGQVTSSGPITTATLWGDTMWSATATAGRFTTTDLLTGGVTGTVTTDVPCVPREIQVLGRWLYWSCGTNGPAGVHDLDTKKSVRVPAGNALLGDGYVLRHTDGRLTLTDVRGGTAVDRTIADLPANAYPDDRGVVWTLDKFRGFLAYTDADGTTHVVPSGLPRTATTVLTTRNEPLMEVYYAPWTPRWDLTGPVTHWTVELRKKGVSAVVRTFRGTARDTVSLTWDGARDSGAVPVTGDYIWTLSLWTRDALVPVTTSTGTVAVHGGSAEPRDYTRDGVGDLLAVTSAGRLDIRTGTGTGSVSGGSGPQGAGWPMSSTLVAVNDLTGNRCNDLLVRNSAGQLTRYDGKCGAALTPALSRRVIGSGWNTYNFLVSPGDLTGDGRPDLLGRDAAGVLWRYDGTAAGVFTARVKIGSGWNTYNLLVGAQDVTGDGLADLLARDAAGVLWRYDATGAGTFKPRVKIGSGWNVYNALVGVGDITGDGRADLVARDAAGVLWRYSGTGTGQFGARVKIGTGWQTYKSLF